MRKASSSATVIVFALGAALCAGGATMWADFIETTSAQQVRAEIAADGLTWAEVDTNGLQVALSGDAPTEAARFSALSAAGRAVDANRVIDHMRVAETQALAPPRFSVEILRNAAGLSLIGLVPRGAQPQEIMQAILRRVGPDVPVTELLESADFPQTPTWRAALDFALAAAVDLPRAKISVEDGRVAVTALADSPADRDRIEAELVRRAPPEVSLALDITAPRPVIAPYALRFVHDGDAARFEACSAPDAAARDAILAAAQDAGLAGPGRCAIGLGAPSDRWTEAAIAGLRAIGRMQGGTLTMANSEIDLLAAPSADAALWETVAGELDGSLPQAFALTARRPETPETTADDMTAPRQFIATRSPEGLVQLRGRVKGPIGRDSTESVAHALFGAENVHMATLEGANLPVGWTVRVLAGLQALELLENGAVIVTDSEISVTGRSVVPQASTRVAGMLAQALGTDAAMQVDITEIAPPEPEPEGPTPEDCEAMIVEVVGTRKITFEPGSATLDASAKDILDEIADVMKLCADVPFEIQGHTDSQGRESMNQNLSQQRAEAVLAALRMRRVLTGNFAAVGYGEARPIADNGTEDGREANRRIEFRLIAPESETDTETTLESMSQTGETPRAEGSDGGGAGE